MQVNVQESASRAATANPALMQALQAASSAGAQALPNARAHPPVEPVLGMLLDELDYGVVLLLRDTARVVYVNHAARTQLRGGRSLEVVDGALSAGRPADAALLVDALAAARRGLRRLITLGVQGTRVEVALIPIGETVVGGQPLVAAVFGRRRLCEQMSMEWFARAHGLTPAEEGVLELLCNGLDPRDIAAANKVRMATVRTQLICIRDKTGAASIRALLQRLAMLPPMVSLLRC